MKTGIFYISHHGTTEKVAKQINDETTQQSELINIKKSKGYDLNSYDLIVLGSSIHAGSNQRKMKKFIDKNLPVLLRKKLALILCCMDDTEKREQQFDDAYPEELRIHSSAKLLAGGEFLFEKMNFIEKAIIKKISGDDKNKSNIDNQAINNFIKTLNAIN